MKITELMERTQRGLIVVDVQPAYQNVFDFQYELAEFMHQHTGPILMFVNADDQGLTEDTKQEIHWWWYEVFENVGLDFDEVLPRIEYYDKGYGYMRSWMDSGIADRNIIRTIRKLYLEGVNDTRQLFEYEDDPAEELEKFVNDPGWDYYLADDPLTTEWLSIAQLKRFNRSYICGGGRNECLKEVQLMMNAFNIKYTEIEKFIY